MSNKKFAAVENGLTRQQYDRIVAYVEKMIFDGCGGRKMRTMYLIETGKMFKKGNVKTAKMRSYYISTKYRGISPISNMDRIIHNILNVTEDDKSNRFPGWMKDETTLRIALNATAGIV